MIFELFQKCNTKGNDSYKEIIFEVIIQSMKAILEEMKLSKINLANPDLQVLFHSFILFYIEY